MADVPGPECEVFQKSYRYIKPDKAVQKPEILFFNDDGLLDDLPELDVKQIRKKNSFRVPKKYRLQAEQEYLSKKKLMLVEQIRKVDNELIDVENGTQNRKKYHIQLSESEDSVDIEEDLSQHRQFV